jgi:hypothetical protein
MLGWGIGGVQSQEHRTVGHMLSLTWLSLGRHRSRQLTPSPRSMTGGTHPGGAGCWTRNGHRLIWAPAGTDIGGTPQVNRGTAPMLWSPAKNSVAAMRLGMYQDRAFTLRTMRGAR